MLALGIAIVFGAATPSVNADHGFAATYEGVSLDGCRLTMAATYDSGTGTAQTWLFQIAVAGPPPPLGFCGAGLAPANGADGDSCTGFGNIEVGFSGGCAVGSFFDVEGTGALVVCCPIPVFQGHGGISMNFTGFATTSAEGFVYVYT